MDRWAVPPTNCRPAQNDGFFKGRYAVEAPRPMGPPCGGRDGGARGDHPEGLAALGPPSEWTGSSPPGSVPLNARAPDDSLLFQGKGKGKALKPLAPSCHRLRRVEPTIRDTARCRQQMALASRPSGGRVISGINEALPSWPLNCIKFWAGPGQGQRDGRRPGLRPSLGAPATAWWAPWPASWRPRAPLWLRQRLRGRRQAWPYHRSAKTTKRPRHPRPSRAGRLGRGLFAGSSS